MRVVFAGTPDFAAAALAALHGAGFEIPLVLTQPERPAGRGLRLQPSAVKRLALGLGLPLAQPRSLRLDGKFADAAAAGRQALDAAAPDVMVVAAYGLILPQWALTLPRLGCLNIHASLLPRWRGAAPIQRAIEAGDAATGITIMQMDAGLDTGPMLLEQVTPIGPDDSLATMHLRLAAIGATLIVQALRRLEAGDLAARLQPVEAVTYAHKIDKAEAAIHWSEPAAVIERRVRAFDPAPGMSFVWGGEVVKLWRARAHPGQGVPGAVFDLGAGRLGVACGAGLLELVEVQRPGGRRSAAAQYLQSGPGLVLRAGCSLARDTA